MSPAEIAQGLGEIYAEINGQERSAYGAVTDVRVSPDRVTIELDPTRSVGLGSEPTIEIRFDSATVDATALCKAVEDLLDGTSTRQDPPAS